MKVAVLGAGNIGFANAALLASRGHAPVLWSPSGRGTAGIAAGTLRASGALDGVFPLAVAADLGVAVRGADAVVLGLPAFGHAAVMRALAVELAAGQPVFVMPMLALGASYLDSLLATRGVRAPIAASATTAMTARRTGPDCVSLISLRSRLDIAALEAADTPAMLALATTLFGERFVAQTDMLAIAMSNVNPISHVPLALANLTRIEKGEAWTQYDHMVGGVARMISAIDRERMAVARALGLRVRSIEEHFHHSFGVPLADLGTQAQMVHDRLGSLAGPTSLSSRYFTEDVPFGLAFYCKAGRAAGVGTPVLDACVMLAGQACGVDFAADNELTAQVIVQPVAGRSGRASSGAPG